jgi:hypothetical protein
MKKKFLKKRFEFEIENIIVFLRTQKFINSLKI